MKRAMMTVLAVAVVLVISSGASAAVLLRVDVGAVESVQSGWEQQTATSATFGDYTVALSGFSHTESGFYNRGGVTNGNGMTYAEVYNDFFYLNKITPNPPGTPLSGTVEMDITLSGDGIAANTQYTMTFYTYDSFSASGDHTVTYTNPSSSQTVSGAWSPSLPTTNDQYAVTGTFTSDAAGQLTIGMTDVFNATDSAGIRLNGLELSEAIPEPATMSLLALGGLGVLIRRRKK